MASTITFRVGDATVVKIPDLALDTEAGVLYPDLANDPTAVEETRKLWPDSVDPLTDLLRQSADTNAGDPGRCRRRQRQGPSTRPVHEPPQRTVSRPAENRRGFARRRSIWC